MARVDLDSSSPSWLGEPKVGDEFFLTTLLMLSLVACSLCVRMRFVILSIKYYYYYYYTKLEAIQRWSAICRL